MGGATPAGVLSSLAVVCASMAAWRRREPAVAATVRTMTLAAGVGSARSGRLDEIGRRWLRRRSAPRALRRRLELSGLPWTIERVMGLKVVGAAGGVLVGAVLTAAVPPAAPMLALGALLGYRGPDLVIARRARRRQALIELHVPDLVELLVATTEAGLGPSVAVRRSASVIGGPLGDELARASAELDLGVPWAVAMTHLVERTDVPSLGRLAAALSRSNRMGTSVRTTLRGVAGDLRAERRLKAEEAARRAPVKMLFPLVFLILPAFLLLTVGPVVMATIQSLRSGG